MIAVPIGLSAVLILLALLAVSSLRILREYQRGVVFQLGRFWRVKGPGLVILIPGIQQMVRIDLRIAQCHQCAHRVIRNRTAASGS